MTSSKFRSEITREPWHMELIGATHTGPGGPCQNLFHFLNIQLCIERFFIHNIIRYRRPIFIAHPSLYISVVWKLYSLHTSVVVSAKDMRVPIYTTEQCGNCIAFYDVIIPHYYFQRNTNYNMKFQIGQQQVNVMSISTTIQKHILYRL